VDFAFLHLVRTRDPAHRVRDVARLAELPGAALGLQASLFVCGVAPLTKNGIAGLARLDKRAPCLPSSFSTGATAAQTSSPEGGRWYWPLGADRMTALCIATAVNSI
jgi:hypothetical protein